MIPTHLLVHPDNYMLLMKQLEKEGLRSQVSSMTRHGLEIMQSPYVPKSYFRTELIFYRKKHPRKRWQPKYRIVEYPMLGYWMNLDGFKLPVFPPRDLKMSCEL